MKKQLFWLIIVLFGLSTWSCSSNDQDPEESSEEVSVDEDDFDDEDFEDEDFDDEDFDDEDFDEQLQVGKAKSQPINSSPKTVSTSKKVPKTRLSSSRIVLSNRSSTSRGASLNNVRVTFKPSLGGWVVDDQSGDGFVVSFKSSDQIPFQGEFLTQTFDFKGKSGWRLPTFDEAIYLLEILPFDKMTPGSKEFWTSTQKGNNVYVFDGLNKTYRVSNEQDSCAVMFVRTI